MKVSVIIPAYNAEEFLVETLESIVNQTLDDFEVIVVNDGSKDSTIDILREYEKNYDFFRVIDKENGGPSAARNDGLDVANGEYVFFFDSDDILELDALENLYNRAKSKRAELVIAGYDIFDNYTVTPINDIKELIQEDSIDRYDERILQTFSLSNKLLKKSVIDKYHLRLAPISYSEDGAFLMNYVYHISRITGLDMVIFHYRRLNGEGNAITETISEPKVRDYIEAHRLIIKSATESLLRDNPKYKTIEELKAHNPQLGTYINRIAYKELTIMIKQFYSKFWNLDQNTIDAIVDEINDKLNMLDMKNMSELVDENPDFFVHNMDKNKKDVFDKASFTAVLYGEESDEENFIESLKALCVQTLVGLRIVVPANMKSVIEKAELLNENVVLLDADSESELYFKALDSATTKYITFSNSKFVYAQNAFKYVLKRFIKAKKDFLVELIYHNNYGDPQPVYLNKIAQESVTFKMSYNPDLFMDNLLANKFFRVKFAKKLFADKNNDLLSYVSKMYQEGAYSFFDDTVIFYNDKEDTFEDYIATNETKDYIANRLKETELTSLKDDDAIIDPAESFTKLIDKEPENFADRVMKLAINRYTNKPVKNRTLFISIRKDGELEGNAKALYPYIKGNKVVYAKKLPHNIFQMLKMIKLIATSKVIITDDYVKYLRHFTLKKKQRVIQLWHACGAFKKFGQRGTNMSVYTDNATHAQYNVACVSGDYIRTIYADAFNINLKKVKTLGAPRTDEFFDQELIEAKKKEVYAKYKDLKDKEVIIYAPTFRDIGDGREVFKPAINFDKLSKNLLPNQQFVICPHPVMKNDIIPKKYDNIKVIRDFSTNDLMLISDMLVTDYSSVIFEYALLRKPIAFFCYDLEVYNRGFYLQYPDDLPGDVYETQKELEAFLTSDNRHELSERYNTFVNRYMSGCDGKSCERIAGLINNYLEGK